MTCSYGVPYVPYGTAGEAERGKGRRRGPPAPRGAGGQQPGRSDRQGLLAWARAQWAWPEPPAPGSAMPCTRGVLRLSATEHASLLAKPSRPPAEQKLVPTDPAQKGRPVGDKANALDIYRAVASAPAA